MEGVGNMFQALGVDSVQINVDSLLVYVEAMEQGRTGWASLVKGRAGLTQAVEDSLMHF